MAAIQSAAGGKGDPENYMPERYRSKVGVPEKSKEQEERENAIGWAMLGQLFKRG